MSVGIVVGAQWGDEGKAKVIDYVTERADFVARYQGGANAGHTVVAQGKKYIFHLVPSGILYPGKTCVIGNGVVVDPVELLAEIDGLEEQGIDVMGRLVISPRAHMIAPFHKALDKASEERKGTGAIGTTGRGIGPAYADKAARAGLRIGDLLDPDRFRRRLESALAAKNRQMEKIFGAESMQVVPMVDTYLEAGERLAPLMADVSLLLNRAMSEGKRILLEGAQGTLLDLDHGTYPYVTSSNPVAGGACLGVGIGPTRVQRVVGIAKAYITRVGNGPFPTEMDEETGEKMRELGGEYGATTGRPRRCGWFDAVAARHAARVNGLDEFAITKLDVLDTFDEILVCDRYRISGKETQDFPMDPEDLDRVQPIYETVPGWKSSTVEARCLEDLPPKAREYLDHVAELTGVPVGIVSVGPDRSETLTTPNHRLFVD